MIPVSFEIKEKLSTYQHFGGPARKLNRPHAAWSPMLCSNKPPPGSNFLLKLSS